MTEPQDNGPQAQETAPVEQGFTLIIALVVMVLLTTLGLTLMFSSETERAMSRNFSGQIQAAYAAEAVVEPMVDHLLLDLRYDSTGWANQYLIVCELSTAASCLSKYGFTPNSTTDVPCYNATPANSCVLQDTTGTITGRTGVWVARLNWRPSGVTRPTFPSLIPMRLHKDLKAVMPWWKHFEINASNSDDPDRLNSGEAGIALTSICTANCTSASPTYASDEIFVTGIGEAQRKVLARITQSKRPATRAVTLRVKGTNLYLWGNALVGGLGGNPQQNPIINGNYLIRGSTMQFNDDPSLTVLQFPAANTGIVNNWYDSDSVPAISSWWWLSARGCGTAYCDSNNVTDGSGVGDSGTGLTVEAIAHHLPHPPDQDTTDTHPGGFRSGNSDFVTSEGLDSVVRIKSGLISISAVAAGIGRTETTEGAASSPGYYWDNILDLFTGDTPSMSDFTGANATNVYRNSGSTWNLATKSGTFDISSDQVRFPNLQTEPYTEPTTGEVYTNYYDFLRPTSASDSHPGGWPLDLSGIDGTTGVSGTITAAQMDPGGATETCWPRTGAPSAAELEAAFGDLNPSTDHRNIRHRRCTDAVIYYYDATANASGTGTGGLPFCTNIGNCSSGNNACVVRLSRSGSSSSTECPATIDLTIFRRTIRTQTADPVVNLDTSSSLDTPRGRAQATMFNSFAYKLYVDVLAAVNSGTCDATQSVLYQNNLSNLPNVFRQTIPTAYPGANAADACSFANFAACFRERSAYLDVHIQLPDLPMGYYNTNGKTDDADATIDELDEATTAWDNDSGTNTTAAADTAGAGNELRPYYWPGGRWFSVRFRPPGAAQTMTVLSDPRVNRRYTAASGVGAGAAPLATSCLNSETNAISGGRGPRTDLAAEVRDYPEPGFPQIYRASAAPATGGTAFHLVDFSQLNPPPGYDRAQPLHPDDREFRNMPTGAFVVSLHLPCDPNTSGNNNPYKCSPTGNANAPSVSYEGFYTHILAYAPKYTCWTTDPTTWTQNPPHFANNTTSYPGCSVLGCPNPSWSPNAQYVSWFAESMWMANMTTLRNDPVLFSNGTRDISSPAGSNVPAALTGFKLFVPTYQSATAYPPLDSSPNSRTEGRGCQMGLDRYVHPPIIETCNGRVWYTCGVDNDGIPNNGNYCTPDASSPAGTPDSGLTGGKNGTAPSNQCQNEPYMVFGSTNSYGGCNEIFSPLASMRIAELDPSTGPFARTGLAAGCNNSFPCATVAGTGNAKDYNCIYRGVDPDTLAGTRWDSTRVNRYGRGWPGWGSVSVLETAGLILTRDGIRFGSPQIGGSATYNAGSTNQFRGYYSDPIVYDGRAIIYAGNATTAQGTPRVWYHDHVVPRTRMGCSDFLSVLSNADTRIDMQMPYDATAKRHMLALFNLTQGILQVVSSDTAIQHELVGSWFAEAASFGSFTNPVQLIGVPSIASDECDHTYLPGRDPLPQGTYISFVEDEIVPGNF